MNNAGTRWKIAGISIVLLSVLIQILTARCGVLLTYDSHQYLSAANSFDADGTFFEADGTPYVFWPPLFPFVLSLLDEPVKAMQWIHLVLSALIGLLVWMATTRLLSDDRFRISFFIAFMCGVYQLMISVFLWSELLFLVLLLLFSESLIRCRLSLWALSGVFIFGTLMCLQRNAGLFLVPAAALWIWLVIADRRKSVLAAVFTLTSTWAGVWWNVSNMFVSKTEVSELQYGEFIWPNFLMMTDGLTRSLVPITVLSIPFAMLMVAIPAVLLWRNRQKSPEPFLGILYVGAYVGGISTLFEMDPSDADRYTAVILPSLMLPIFVVSEKFFKSGAKIVRQVVLAVMFVWLLYPLARTLKNAFQWHESSCQMATSNKASK